MKNDIIKFSFILIINIILITGCNDEKNISGIWIPNSFNWDQYNGCVFNTFYFYNKDNFVLLTSYQNLYNDSLYFQAEPGFNLRDGKIIRRENDYLIVKYRMLYRMFIPPGDTLPGKIIVDTIFVNRVGKNINSLLFNNKKYVKDSTYTKYSKHVIMSFPNDMIPAMKKKYNLK